MLVLLNPKSVARLCGPDFEAAEAFVFVRRMSGMLKDQTPKRVIAFDNAGVDWQAVVLAVLVLRPNIGPDVTVSVEPSFPRWRGNYQPDRVDRTETP